MLLGAIDLFKEVLWVYVGQMAAKLQAVVKFEVRKNSATWPPTQHTGVAQV